jgi:hypothetical protein
MLLEQEDQVARLYFPVITEECLVGQGAQRVVLDRQVLRA